MLTSLIILGALGAFSAYCILHDENAKKKPSSGSAGKMPQAKKPNVDEGRGKTKYINSEFRCGISCKNVRELPADYEVEYEVNGKKYVGYQTLQKEVLDESEHTYGANCSRIKIYRDEFGNKAVALIKDIPCFDFYDREYDRYNELFLFHDGSQIHALHCREGYKIANLTLCENVSVGNIRLRLFLKENGFPV